MTKTTRLLVVAGVVGAAALAGGWKYRAYRRDATALQEQIAWYEGQIKDRDQHMSSKAGTMRDLKKVAATTLGSDEEMVAAELRKSLNQVVSHYKLADANVTSVRPIGVKNPAAQERVTEFSEKEKKGLKDLPDFYTVPATLSGKGSLEQVTRVLATLQAQPWVHKVTGFSLKPLGKERDKFELSVSLQTIYLADAKLRDAKPGEELGWTPVSEDQYALWRPIVMKNVFKEPPPDKPITRGPSPAPETPVAAANPPPPPPPPYEDWRVSGMTRGVRGAELMIVNDKTKEWRSLTAGGLILDVKFLDVSGEVARVAIGDKEFEIRSGQRLSERSPVTQAAAPR